MEYECCVLAARNGRYILVPTCWHDWKVTHGLWAEFLRVSDYVGLVVTANADSAWWFAHCTGWALNVGLYLVRYSYETGLFWWIPHNVRNALRVLPESALRLYHCADVYVDLQRFLDTFERTEWDDVPIRKSARVTSSRRDWSPTLERAGGDDLWIYPESGGVVDQWSAKGLRRGIYAGDTPFPDVRDAARYVPEPEHTNRQNPLQPRPTFSP